MQWASLFRRITTSADFIPEIDGFRFVAIISVVAFHLREQLHRYFPVSLLPIIDTLSKNGERGVRLFFVISGFILALPFARHHLLSAKEVPLKKYFLRRVTRLEPPYILSLLVLSLLAFASGRTTTLPETGGHLIASMLYLHNMIFGQPSSISVVTWSLEVEIQFYLLVPLLSLLFKLRATGARRLLIIALMLIVGTLQICLKFSSHPRLAMSVANYLQFFLAGFLLADLFLVAKKTYNRQSFRWDLVALLTWPLIFLVGDQYLQLLSPFLILTVYWAGFNGVLSRKFFSLPAITAIGGMCYSIYLVHYALIALATRAAGHTRPVSMVLLSLTLIALVSSAFFLLVEKPCMNPNWPRSLFRRAPFKSSANGPPDSTTATTPIQTPYPKSAPSLARR